MIRTSVIASRLVLAFVRATRVLALVCLAVTCVPSFAQESKIDNTVRERARPELDARGLRLGSFRLFPTLGLGLMSNSNIFAMDAIEVDDLIWFIEPELILQSDWTRNELELGFDLAAARYADFDNEDYDDWRIWADTAVTLGRGELTGFARYADLHEPRTSPDNRFGVQPTLYTQADLSIGYGQPFGRFTGNVEVRRRRLEFEDTIRMNGPFSNADRDRNRSDLRLRVGHQTMPGLQPFVQFSLTEVEYDQRFDRDGFERSSDGFDVVGGTGIDLTGRTFGEAYAGYVRRDYNDSRFRTVDGPIFGGEITWNVTGLTTMILSADRQIRGTTIEGAAGILDSGFGLGVDHELLRNLLLGLDIKFNNEDFEGVDRDDDIFQATLESIYMLNRYLRIRAAYTFQSRNTSALDSGGFEYRIHRLYVGAEAQF